MPLHGNSHVKRRLGHAPGKMVTLAAPDFAPLPGRTTNSTSKMRQPWENPRMWGEAEAPQHREPGRIQRVRDGALW